VNGTDRSEKPIGIMFWLYSNVSTASSGLPASAGAGPGMSNVPATSGTSRPSRDRLRMGPPTVERLHGRDSQWLSMPAHRDAAQRAFRPLWK
jgi:hypothetical protein